MQLPAVMTPGVSVVVSPLLSLVQDQVFKALEHLIDVSLLELQPHVGTLVGLSITNASRDKDPGSQLKPYQTGRAVFRHCRPVR